MAKNSIRDYSATASSNTDIQSIDIDENCAASGINNAIREIMADTADFVSGTVGIDVLSLADDDNSAQIKIQAPSAVTTTTTFTLPDGDGDADQVLKTDGSGTLGWVNVAANPSLIINGAMTIHQRGGTISSSASGPYSLDRFRGYSSGGGVFSMEQSTTVPNNTFSNSLKCTVTTNDASVASGDFYALDHRVEGYNIIQTGFGTSDAVPVTLSFWVRSSVTGTYSAYIYNADGTRVYVFTYTISAADTWQKVENTFTGETTGTWNKTNGVGFLVGFNLGRGSGFDTTADAWQTTTGYALASTSSDVEWIGTSSATFYITGVKLEVGSTATDFVHESYGDTLAKCQRYFYKFPNANYNIHAFVYNTSLSIAQFEFPVTMRTLPTMSITDGQGTSTSTGTSPEGFHQVYNDQYSNYVSDFTASAEL